MAKDEKPAVPKTVERAVRRPPENTARALTPAEEQARRTRKAIAEAEFAAGQARKGGA